MRDRLDPEALGAALADLRDAVAWPAPSAAFAVEVRARVEVSPVPTSRADRLRAWLAAPIGARPIRRSLLIAVSLLLIAATVAAAIGLGLPGIRILFGPPPSAVPTRSVDPSLPLGSSMGLGVAVPLAEASTLTGFEPRLPAVPGIGAPAAAFVAGSRLTLVWRATPELPRIEEAAPGVGLLVTEFQGTVDPGYFEKQVFEGATRVQPVQVDGQPGYWISGAPHGLVYRLPGGGFVEETRRMVGDALIWRNGELTLRLETSLGLSEALRIAESLR